MLTRPFGNPETSTTHLPHNPPETAFKNPNLSQAIAQIISHECGEVFSLMGNGNVWFIDALETLGHPVVEVRHEVATVASADAYFRASGKLAVATTTYGPGYTNAISALAEASLARIPLIYVVGDAPTSGLRPNDIAQAEMAAACGVPTIYAHPDVVVDRTYEAIELALQSSKPVVLAIPHDVIRAEVPSAQQQRLANPPQVRSPKVPQPQVDEEVIEEIIGARQLLILAGRGARGARKEVTKLAAALGADVATSAPMRGFFGRTPGKVYRSPEEVVTEPLPGDSYRNLGVCGGFAAPSTQAEMRSADVVLVLGAGLNHFTRAFGDSFAPDARIIQVDVQAQPTTEIVSRFIQGGVAEFSHLLYQHVADRAPRRSRAELPQPVYPQPEEFLGDGRLDPRALFSELNEVLPADRVIVTDGGHFMGWPNMYLDVDGPEQTIMVGTAMQAIGLGFPSAVGAAKATASMQPERTVVMVTGDGGGMMGIADAESFIRVARRGVIVVVNDSAYGAEIHQYAVRGADERTMRLPEFDFAGMLRPLGAETMVIRRLADLAAAREWFRGVREGTLVLDCRVSREVVASFISEMGKVASAAAGE
ncbi:thiamine pyrophosphate-binding protein [Corynebacterium spheniscorum]|uniref:acetolactate synthase n=1 Tax=Corynebacterium spheniscorum TaxID=185761 RepID=A0A1I2QIU1_9CORY|nr:thiamine pyrophosphate-binding protein [Corynebacterium spheniscorum]KAA8719379.1 thiamine pyrophosphate-binding protein [Corynebacterium spheniscorum]SFG28515.1 Acetolactate synthase large subunit [Corynebacterium spheniscorum]